MLVAWIVAVTLAADERWQFRGQVENRSLFYTEESATAPARASNDTLLRVETGWRLGRGWQWRGALDAQTATAGQVTNGFDWFDATERRPAVAVRQLFLRYARGPVTLELGKQPLEWSSLDLLSPADRVAPRDLMSPSGATRLGVWAARLAVDTGRHRVEGVWLPRFTPSRIPLMDQRWAVAPASIPFFTTRYTGRGLPGGPQFGGRYTWIHPRAELSAVLFDGYQPLPSTATSIQFLARRVDYRFLYPRHRLVSGAATIPWAGWLWKSEVARLAPDGLWSGVLMAERARRHWTAGAGWLWTRPATGTAPAYASGFVGRATWTPRTRHTLSAEGGVQRNGQALVSRFLYTRDLRHGVRTQAGYVWIRGARTEWLSRYAMNSHALLEMDWSF